MEVDNTEFIDSLKSGDVTCYEYLFKRFYSSLVVYANHLLGNNENSEDFVHDVFISLWEKRKSLDITFSLKSYLFSAVKNRCLNHLEHLQVRNQYQQAVLKKGDVNGFLTWEYYDEFELRQMIENAIKKLPPQCQKVFIMNRFQNMTMAEIASETGISVRTVQKHIEKAVRFLKIELKDYLPILLIIIVLKHNFFDF